MRDPLPGLAASRPPQRPVVHALGGDRPPADQQPGAQLARPAEPGRSRAGLCDRLPGRRSGQRGDRWNAALGRPAPRLRRRFGDRLRLATLDGVGDAHHVRFARFSVDRIRLAYADVEQERHRNVWDLRLFGQPGRRRLDFTAIRQPWLREATKAWTAATAGRVGEQTLRHRVGSVAVLSAVLAAGARGGADPTVLTRPDWGKPGSWMRARNRSAPELESPPCR